MRNIDNNFLRLFLLATHLQSREVADRYPINRYLHFVHFEVYLFNEGNGGQFNFIFPFVIREMPVLFSEWSIVNGRVVYVPEPTLPDSTALCEFLGLGILELYELFIPKRLTGSEKATQGPQARPGEIGEKVLEFLESALNSNNNSSAIIH